MVNVYSLEPRGLKLKDAAYCAGFSVSGYRRAVRQGLLPGPMRDPITGKKLSIYDRKAIDAAYDWLSGFDKKDSKASALEKWKSSRNGY